jgi:hypothetical protein
LSAVTRQALSEHCHKHKVEGPPLVQARIRGAVLCGRLVESTTFNDGTDAFKVVTALGQGWVPGRNLRLCSHVDERCGCVATTQVEPCFEAGQAAQAGAERRAEQPGLPAVGGGTC